MIDHGGPGKSSGRPTNASKGLPKKVKRSITLSEEADIFVQDVQDPEESYSQTVDRLLLDLNALWYAEVK